MARNSQFEIEWKINKQVKTQFTRSILKGSTLNRKNTFEITKSQNSYFQWKISGSHSKVYPKSEFLGGKLSKRT